MEKDAMEQSQQAFRAQFDPNSPNYHHGSTVPVPTGGDRVPTSMPSMYPEGYNPNQVQQAIDYGEQYKQVEENRAVYQNLKKELAKLGPVVEAFLRHEQIFRDKADPTNEQHVKKHEQTIAKQKENLKAVQDLLASFVPTLDKMDAQGKECSNELTEILNDSNAKHTTKEQLGVFNFKLKKLSAKTFSIAQKCLQRLKDIKKEYAKKQKEQELAANGAEKGIEGQTQQKEGSS